MLRLFIRCIDTMANPEHERVLWQAHHEGPSNVDMAGFDLSRVAISCARLEGANLAKADLRRSDFSGARLKDSDLRGARLGKSRLVRVDLRGANLAGADLTGSDLSNSVLSSASLTDANLAKAVLVKTMLEKVDLAGANLDKADFRGAQGLTVAQLAAARNADKAIFDERMLAALGQPRDPMLARHGRVAGKRKPSCVVDLLFPQHKPSFGDLFLLCGQEHPEFPATGDYGFADLHDLGIEQVDDFFAVCRDGDPVIWLYPLVEGKAAAHHPGPFDGLRIELADTRHKKSWESCVARFRERLQLP